MFTTYDDRSAHGHSMVTVCSQSPGRINQKLGPSLHPEIGIFELESSPKTHYNWLNGCLIVFMYDIRSFEKVTSKFQRSAVKFLNLKKWQRKSNRFKLSKWARAKKSQRSGRPCTDPCTTGAYLHAFKNTSSKQHQNICHGIGDVQPGSDTSSH